MDLPKPDLPLWKRLALFAPPLALIGASAAAILAAGYVMVRQSEVYSATIFLVFGGLIAWYVLAIGIRVARGQWE